MSRAAALVLERASAAGRFAADAVVLLRMRVASFVVLAAFVGAVLAGGPQVVLAEAGLAAVLVGLTAGAASIYNQLLERDTDARMERTRERPLVTGRVQPRDAVLLGGALLVVGVAGLALRFGLLSALLALGTFTSYVLVYTPLKRTTTFNTVVGAIPGAMPPLLGYTALAGDAGAWGWCLFAVLFVWQFPHFLAIAWLYREDYARAGMQMLPALPGHEGVAARMGALYGLVLIPVSLLPAVRGMAGGVYVTAALVLGALYVGSSILFALRVDRKRARAVLWTSLVYLPLLFSAVLLDPAVRASALS